MSLVVGLVLAVAAQALAGWWLLAVVAFGWGVFARTTASPAARLALGVLLAGMIRLGWEGFRGAPVGEVGRLMAEITAVPAVAVWGLAFLLPALVALCAATLGVAAGKRFLFG